MNDALLFWAHLNVLTFLRLQKLKALFGDLKTARRSFGRSLLGQLGCDSEKAEEVLARAATFDAASLLARMQRLGVRLIFVEDDDYPTALREIPTPPVFLFVRGKFGCSTKLWQWWARAKSPITAVSPLKN